MKSLWRLSLVLVVLVTALGISPVLAQDSNPPKPVLGAVNIWQPEVYATRPGETETRLVEKSVVVPGETLRTDKAGIALITWFYDGTETVLGQNTSLTLNNFSGDAKEAFTVDMTLKSGHVVSGMGDIANTNDQGTWTLKTPAFTVKLLTGQFEVTAAEDGTTTLIVTEGKVDVLVGDAKPFSVEANQFLVGAPGTAQTLSEDGVTPNSSLTDLCTATAPTNLNIRIAPNEDSRKLGGVQTGQVLWIRSATEGDLWYQVYFQTAPDDTEAHNYGWVYGPAVDLNKDKCGTIVRAPLDAHLYGGFGVDKPGTTESNPIGSGK